MNTYYLRVFSDDSECRNANLTTDHIFAEGVNGQCNPRFGDGLFVKSVLITCNGAVFSATFYTDSSCKTPWRATETRNAGSCGILAPTLTYSVACGAATRATLPAALNLRVPATAAEAASLQTCTPSVLTVLVPAQSAVCIPLPDTAWLFKSAFVTCTSTGVHDMTALFFATANCTGDAVSYFQPANSEAILAGPEQSCGIAKDSAFAGSRPDYPFFVECGIAGPSSSWLQDALVILKYIGIGVGSLVGLCCFCCCASQLYLSFRPQSTGTDEEKRSLT
jgi:hypothetical protein